MRALLTNSVRPRPGAPQSALHNASSTALRNTRGSQLRNKLTFCDAFTILLAPVLTAAFVADITIKDKRRRLLDQKIAQVEREVNELRDKELQIWSVSQFRSVQNGLLGQRRGYATAATATLANHANNSSSSNENIEDNIVRSTEATGDPSVALERFENLLATKVGLQLLVYIYTGRDPSGKFTMETVSDTNLIPSSLDALTNRLANVNRGLYELRNVLSKHPGITFEPAGDHQLDAEISQLTWSCRAGTISIEELVIGFTKAVIQSRTGLSLNTYQNLVETFSTLKADPFTFITMMPYLNTHQILSDRNVANIIYQYGNLKESRRLGNFLDRLRDNGRSFRTVTSWNSVDVNGIRVAVPDNRRPRILDTLIRAALQGDQPHKARAWATVLLNGDVTSGRMASLFNNFLTYCARSVDWTAGQLWLERAVAWTALFAHASPWMLERIVFRMMDLCLSCGQHEYYNNILNAAVLAGINPPPTDETRPPSFSDQAHVIRADWASRIAEKQHDVPNVLDAVNAAITFQKEVGKIYFAIQNCIGVTDIEKLKSLLSNQEASSKHVALNKSSIASFGPADVAAFEPFNSLSSTLDRLPIAVAAGSGGSEDFVDPRQFASLQQAYNDLRQQHDDHLERDRWLQKLIVTGSLSDWQASGHDGLKEFAQRLIKVQGQRAVYQETISELHRELEDLKSQNMYLAAELEARDKTEHELIVATDELRSQLQTMKPKSLEAVFVEKENLNLRADLQILSERYLNALKEKEVSISEMKVIRRERDSVQQEMVAFRARRDRLDEKRLADLHLLHQDNRNLQLQAQAAETRYQKLLASKTPREGRFEPSTDGEQETSGSQKDEERFTFQRRKRSRGSATEGNPESTFSFSSS